MEYSQTMLLAEARLAASSLNPYSNGILTDYGYEQKHAYTRMS